MALASKTKMATQAELAQRGQGYLEEVLRTSTDPEERAEAERLLGAGEKALAVVGKGVLRQAEFSRLADESRDRLQQAAVWKDSLDDWWAKKQEELAQGREAMKTLERMKKAGGGLDTDDADGEPAGTAPAPGLSQKDLDAAINTRIGQAGAQLMQMQNFLGSLMASHHKEFGELLDPAELSKFCEQNRLDLRSGYEAFVRDRRIDLADKKRKEELEAAEKRGREKALSEMQGAPPPYSGLGQGPAFAAHLDAAMTKKSDRPADRGVGAAVAAYLKGELRSGA